MYADLHLHSTYSDGTDTPEELCSLAFKSGVSVISITDHDAVGAYSALAKATLPKGLRIIPGVEISTTKNLKMIHILGYHIDIYNKTLESFMERTSIEKTESTRLNFANARQKEGFFYDWERVLELNPGQLRISGIHVIKAMEFDRCGITGLNLWDFFKKYFLPTSADYISVETANAYDAVDVIKAASGIPVIAHPVTLEDDDTVTGLLRGGAQGLEVFHPVHSDADTYKYLRIAKREKAFITGGTDWHGTNSNRFITHFAMKGLENGDYAILQ